MKKTISVLTLLTVLTLCGCNNTPIDKLKSDKKYPELAKMWHVERQKNTELWQQAVRYCNADAGSFISYNKKPNCQAVIDEYLESKINGKLNAHPLDSAF